MFSYNMQLCFLIVICTLLTRDFFSSSSDSSEVRISL